ncbi:hypothetical protein OESDEN_05027 [Oesophagostomum dentatum]|uniref:Uncharacterized protein n=1 Tax=Oesophagostomum dentatum TaxID=61180 RepID=A0A0B1TBU7_OESDE|nr:hypothetical protein OESDEN_05027 [Oesophagostomum dentatum]
MEITVQQLLCLTTFFVCLIPVGTVNKLVFVQAVWGDGHIAPRKRPYPKDPYNETAWPRGWDRLTDLGIQQLYELGTFFREEYNTFIKQSHVREEVAIYSSMSDSAAISAQVFTFGFYPAQGNFQYQNISSWQPIPIHEVGDLKCEVHRGDTKV